MHVSMNHQLLREGGSVIIDIHAHIFPFLGGASGFDSVSTHLMYFQKAASTPANAVRRVEDNAVVEGQTLWDENEPGPRGAYDVNLRAGKFGRLEWTKDGINYYLQLWPPSLQDMTAPAEFMLSEMDYAGVDVAVLQNAFLYGQLNEYIAGAVRSYPNRFVGQAQINETEAYKESQIIELRRAVRELGLTGGLYYSDRRFWEKNYRDHIDDEKFFPFWEEVRGLGIPVFWCLSAIPNPEHPHKSSLERYLCQMRRLDNWLRRFPDIPVVLVHGVPFRVFRAGDNFLSIPDEIWDIWKKPNVHLEVLFPVQVSYPKAGASEWDYPYSQVRPLIRELHEELGARKLLWGSDMPNVNRNCTYKQSLDYLVRYCTFITPNDMDLIVGGNAARLLKLD